MHEEYLRRAIELSRARMLRGDGGPFGALVVKVDAVVGEGWNRVASTGDPTAHAEICAIRDACARLGTFTLAGCSLYSSCEPCPMCFAAIRWARVDRVYFAAHREDAAGAGFDDERVRQALIDPPPGFLFAAPPAFRDQARAVFGEWRVKKDKISY